MILSVLYEQLNKLTVTQIPEISMMCIGFINFAFWKLKNVCFVLQTLKQFFSQMYH